MDNNLCKLLFQTISVHYKIVYDEIEYAYNKLESIDLLLEAIEIAHKDNISLPKHAHELRKKLKGIK